MATAIWIAARLRNYEHELDRPFPQRVLDASPERRPAGEIEDIGPDLIAEPRQLGPEPAHEIVVVRCGVADEDDITVGHDLSCPRRVAQIEEFFGDAFENCGF